MKIYEEFLMHFALYAVIGFALFGICWWIVKMLMKYIDDVGRGGRVTQILAILATVAIIVYAGTKPPINHVWRFEFVNGVRDNGSFCTNNLICAAWTYDSAAMEFSIRAYYQDLTVTNELGECTDELHQLSDALVRDCSRVWALEEGLNAENMRVVIYGTYVPPPVVSTNGVYRLSGVMPSMDGERKYVTPGIRISASLEGGGTAVLTPTNEPPASASLLQTPDNQEE